MPVITTTDGVAIDVTDEGSGPVVALVGGFGGHAEGWDPVAAPLVAAGYRVLRIDRRSHGRSAHVTHGQDLHRHGADVGEALAALEVRRAVWVGASMGASAAWAWIDRSGSARLAGVVSVDQTPAMLDGEVGMHGLDREGLDGWLAGFPATVPNPIHRMPDPAHLALLAGRPPMPMDDLRGLLRDHAVADWRPVIARTDVPVLAVAGRQSPFWPWPHAQAIADLAPDGQAVVLEDCGHVVQLEQPAALVEALLPFLARIATG